MMQLATSAHLKKKNGHQCVIKDELLYLHSRAVNKEVLHLLHRGLNKLNKLKRQFLAYSFPIARNARNEQNVADD